MEKSYLSQTSFKLTYTTNSILVRISFVGFLGNAVFHNFKWLIKWPKNVFVTTRYKNTTNCIKINIRHHILTDGTTSCSWTADLGGGTGIQQLDADFVEDDYVSGPKIEIKFEVPDRAPTCVLKSGTRYSEHVASATFI